MGRPVRALGSVDHPNIKFSTSVIDYIFRVLGYEYFGRTDFLQVKPEDMESDINEPTPASGTQEGAAEPEAKSLPETVQPAGEQNEPTAPEAQADVGSATTEAVADPPKEVTITDGGGVVSTTSPNGNGSPGPASPKGNGAGEHLVDQTFTRAGVLDEQLSQMMGDAPFCDVCGHITIRNGSCYRCLNCGNSMGCS